jgi:diguanylate cyclase (GGDEF)-like protein/PAS domain S-box-containing protein
MARMRQYRRKLRLPNFRPNGARLFGKMPKTSHRVTFRRLICVAVGLIGFSVLAIGLTIWGLRADAIRDAYTDTGNIAVVLSEQMARSVQSVDIVLSDIRERLRAQSATSENDSTRWIASEAANVFLKERLARLSQADFIAFVDKRGQLVNTSRIWPTPVAALADRDYFQHFRQIDDRGIFISKLLVNRVSRQPMIFFSKRISGAHDEFLGVVVTGLRLNYFEGIYNSITRLRHQSFQLLLRDGTMLVRHPETLDRSEKMPAGSPWYKLVASGGGHYRSPGTLDGEARFVSVQPLHEYPLVVDVAVSEAGALENWNRRALLIALGTVLALICFGVLLKALSNQFQHLLRSEESLGEREVSLAEKTQALERANMQIDAALHNMSQGLCMFDADGRLAVVNERYVAMYDLSADIIKPGCTLLDMLEHRRQRGTFTDDPVEYDIKIRGAAQRREKLCVRIELANGRVVEVVNEPTPDGGWVATHDDITERVRAEKERARAEHFLQTVVDHIPATVFVKDASDNRYTLLNKAGEELFGVAREALIGRRSSEVFSDDQAKAIEGGDKEALAAGDQIVVRELPFKSGSDEIRLLNVKRLAIQGEDDETRYILGVAEDVTERKRAEAKIAHLAHHDVLTGLPNRAAFNECFATTLERVRHSGESFALMCLDLDRFKYVNDLFGHAAGDALLCEVARRVEAVTRGAFLARIGGDEFTLIVTESNLPDAAARLAERIVTALGDTIEIEGRKLAANACVGVAIYPTDGADGEKLICNADAALYRAKSEGPGSYRFFEPEMDRQLRESREIQHELKSALERDEFKLLYQPVAKIDGPVIGFEALARWYHPARGLILPSVFIPLAEDSGLIIALGEWVLRAACREAASWQTGAQVAVNLSPAQFRHGDLPTLVHSVLLETGLAPSRLELEITESVLIDDFSRAQAILRRLKNLGVKIAMDDFGTGYSSLSYLQSFPFDKIKIDRSFICDLESNANNAAIVRAVITLAKNLNLPVLAEGVETEEQRLILSCEGCDQIQGYLIGKPKPIEAYDGLVRAKTGDDTVVRLHRTSKRISA